MAKRVASLYAEIGGKIDKSFDTSVSKVKNELNGAGSAAKKSGINLMQLITIWMGSYSA